ncbi:hypothetical protein EGI26_03190 [Lacihabitans sp. CCS-44]|uniref:CotH kinase family protein n=1 Tax=Lacihabitans sp. CCS-44 TaxID=2487331 RepID=UPI0020CC1F9C|nr:CotH kinase family protein [Lacihabitans sp. CCS-44]MCP9754168.1 hypothetical protein [Lacihabitans sp. CCS-44]
MKARIITLIMLFLNHFGFTQIVVNEIMASNSSIIKDNSGAYSDWIEIYNAGNSIVDLNNYFLSDNPEKVDKFQLKSNSGNLQINPKGFLILWCSGFPSRGENHVSFSLSSDNETIILSNPELKIINQVDFKNQRKDIAYGRTVDAGTDLKYFQEPSPNKTNKGIATYLGALSTPIFSKKGGFYDNAFTLNITHEDPTVRLIYTEDGSIPDASSLSGKTYSYKNQYAELPGQSSGSLLTGTFKSKIFQTAIEIKNKKDIPNKLSKISSTWHYSPYYFPTFPIPKATVIRAVATKSGYLNSEIVTETYFLDKNQSKNPEFDIISLNIQEDHLFSFENGVYTAGKLFEEYRIKNPSSISDFCTPGNFTNEGDLFEKPVNFELFRSEKQAVNQNISFKIHGACSRSIPYKSIRLYGKNNFDEFPFFQGQPDLIQDNFILRNSGDDYTGTLIRDVFVHDLVSHLNFGSQKTQPSVVYINGEYWGIQNIRERLDKYYLNKHYGVNLENIDLRKVIWNGPDETEYGDDIHYNKMIDFINNNDLSNNQNYEIAVSFLDPESLIDYQIAEIFVGNIDWPQNNVRLWRNKTPNFAPFAPYGLDGRWRYLFYDADKSLGMIVNAQHDALEIALEKAENSIFKAFIKNQNFKKRFILRFQDHLNTTFDKANSLKIFNTLTKRYGPEIPNHLSRWNTVSNVSQWEANCKVVEKYLTERPESTRQFLKNSFGQFNEKTLNVASTDNSMGYIRVNSIDITAEQPGVFLKNDGSWEGKYFSEIPFTIIAKPLAGHRFLYWEHNTQKLTDSVLVIFLNENQNYTAYFEQIALADENNIPPTSLADCGYFLKEWSSFSAKGSSPPNAKFVFLNQKDPPLNSKIAGFTSGEYNHLNRSRVVGREKEGISFVNTGGPSENEGYPFGQLGGLIIATNTIGIDSAWVSWTAKTIVPGDRKYGIKLLYRINVTDDFKEIDLKTSYTGKATVGHSSTFERIALPKITINQPYVQFFWKYYYTGEGKSGTRDELGLDDIIFETNLDEPIIKPSSNLTGSITETYSNLANTNNFNIESSSFQIISDNFSNIRPKKPAISSQKTEICGTEKLLLRANGCTNGTIFWSNGDMGREITVTEGRYYAYCSASCGISENSNTLQISRVSKTSAPQIEASKDKICIGESVTLRANFCSGQVFWSNGLSGEKIIVKPDQNSSYTANCFSNQCNSDESLIKKINIGPPNKPKIKISSPHICVGQTVYLTAENCDGMVEWSNNISGEVLKLVAEKKGELIFRTRCKAIGGDCFGDWSDPAYIKVNEPESAPNTLAELIYDCSDPKIDLKQAILDSIKADNILYVFHNSNNFTGSPVSTTKNIVPGAYYVYKKTTEGCTSLASKINVRAGECNKTIIENDIKNSADLVIEIVTPKTTFGKEEEIELELKIKNQGKIRASNIIAEVDIPWNFEYIKNSSIGKDINQKILFNISSLSIGNESKIKFKIKANQIGLSIISSKILGFDQNDPDLKNNSYQLTLNSLNNVGLSISEGETKSITNDLFEKSIDVFIENLGEEDVSPIQLNLNLNKAFGNGASFSSENLKIETEDRFAINKDYTGKAENSEILIDSLSILKSKSKQRIRIIFRIDLSKSDKTEFHLNGFLFSKEKLLDISTEGQNPDPDKDGNFTNNHESTVLRFDQSSNLSSIAASQTIVDSTKTNAYNQRFTFMVLIKNIGKTDLKNIKIINNLAESFGKDVLINKIGNASVSKTSLLNINKDFDGIQNIDLLSPNESFSMKPSQIDTLFYTININYQEIEGPFFHNVTISAQSNNGQTVTDTSNNGFQIIPQYSDPTIINLAHSYRDKIIVNGGFSPNNDKINDELTIFIPNGIVLEFLEIYNRWGVKIATFDDTDKVGNHINWSGVGGDETKKYNTMDGTYYYALKVKNDNKIYSDFITIKK